MLGRGAASGRITVSPWWPGDFRALGAAWRALEAEVPHSFFQGWTWVGCLAEDRYPDPVLLRAERDGRTVGLALFNRRAGRLYLTESGDAERDRPFVEHNGPLAADPEVSAALLRAAWKRAGRLVLGGIPPALRDAAGGVALRLQERPAPFLDLDAVRAAGGDHLGALSANARYQIRRSNRRYGGEEALAIARPGDIEELRSWAEDLARLHEASWARRGRPGAFDTPWQRRFHATLMERAFARGELDLLRVTGQSGLVGLLYNFRLAGRVLAYQSGFVDPGEDAHAKPGLTSHARAIAEAVARGDRVYDFLAGDQRYKRSLANGDTTLVWAELARPWSVRALLVPLARALLRRPAG